MAGNQVSGENLSPNLAGMSKSQLYDIMSHMKALIEQNQQQAKGILVQNPVWTKALFQAQIMLGMVQAPQTVSSVQNTAPPQIPESNIQSAPLSQGGHEQKRKQQQIQNQGVSSASNFSLQPKISQLPPPQTTTQSQLTQPPPPPPQRSSHLQPPISMPPPPTTTTTSSQLQQLQPPQVAAQTRPQMQQTFPHQIHSQPNMGFHHPAPPPPQYQQHSQPPMFHQGGTKPQVQYMQGQPPLRNQLPPQPLYQMGGSQQHIGTDYNHQSVTVSGGSSLQGDNRSSSGWTPERTGTSHLPGPPPFPPTQLPPPRPQTQTQFNPEMEKALLDKLLSLTPEEINVLPPDQRSQIIMLQQKLRQ